MYSLSVFGGLRLEHHGAVVDDVVSHRKALALLAILATNGPTSRDSLLALLWPESDTARARGSLKQVLHFLRRSLSAPDLLLGTDELRLNPAVIESDIGKFTEAWAEHDLHTAAALYGGHFLDGFHAGNAAEFERWSAARREQLAQQYAAVLEKLARAAEVESNFAQAASWWRRLQTLDPTNSRFAISLMRALDAAGQRAAALQHARVQELLLREEWGLEPDAAVTALAEELRASPPPVLAPETNRPNGQVGSVVQAQMESARPPRYSRVHWRALAGLILLFASVALAMIAHSARLAGRGSTTVTPAPRRVIVLPFDEARPGQSSHYLAVGLSDAISTDLARLRALIVPSYGPIAEYPRAGKPLAQIARELSATAIVSGTVREVGGGTRVDIQLVDARTNRPLWSQQYEHTGSGALEIQRSATHAIVAALRIDLTKAERTQLARAPTTNARAYDLFLRGRELELRPSLDDRPMSARDIRDAQSLYSHARNLDPNFALARSRLSLMHTYSAMVYDPTTARREQARLEAETAVRIHPGLAEAHEALASYWDVGRRDYGKSVEQLKLALAGWPNSADQHLALAVIYSKQGRWEESLAELERAQELEPGISDPAYWASFTYTRLRRYQDAVKALDSVIAHQPDEQIHKLRRGYVFLTWQGTPDTLAAALQRIPAAWDPNGMGTFARYVAARFNRRDGDALAVLNAARHQVSFDTYVYRPLVLLRAQTHDALGDSVRARAEYESARALLADSIAARPDELNLDYSTATPAACMRIALGLAYAGLGRNREAVAEARRAMALVPLSVNHSAATAVMAGAAAVFIKAGETTAALELLELLLGMPAGREISVPLIRVDPAYDALRGDARFELLLQRFSSN